MGRRIADGFGLAAAGLIVSGGLAYASPSDYADLAADPTQHGGRATKLVQAFTMVEPNTALILGAGSLLLSMYMHHHAK
ncbi:MAG: hypothetical protein GW778_05760 [Alphaproteobacteria bacterium]|nr:hypothetical protein [Alphaproteobacteria bacterium]